MKKALYTKICLYTNIWLCTIIQFHKHQLLHKPLLSLQKYIGSAQHQNATQFWELALAPFHPFPFLFQTVLRSSVGRTGGQALTPSSSSPPSACFLPNRMSWNCVDEEMMTGCVEDVKPIDGGEEPSASSGYLHGSYSKRVMSEDFPSVSLCPVAAMHQAPQSGVRGTNTSR